MSKNKNGKTKRFQVKVPNISPEAVTIAFSIFFCFHENSQQFVPLIQKLLMLQSPDDSIQGLEDSFKKQILPAAQLACLLPMFEKWFADNRSSQNAVTFFYIVFRMVNKHLGKAELTKMEAIELWERIWKFVHQLPIVKTEWEEMEKRNDLKGWKKELQETARNKWTYFNNQQMPKYNDQVKYICENILEFLKSPSTEK
jgi:hypothetical protein